MVRLCNPPARPGWRNAPFGRPSAGCRPTRTGEFASDPGLWPLRYYWGLMRVAIGADHAGYDLKQALAEGLLAGGHELVDVGAHAFDSEDDYPDFAVAVGEKVRAGEADRGIVVCGSGVGSCVAANKLRGIRASVCHDVYSAGQGVEHDDLNVLCLGGRIIDVGLANQLATAFLAARFQPEQRFARRLEKVLEAERRG